MNTSDKKLIDKITKQRDDLLDCLIESHQDEIDMRHHGDDSKTCSYCRVIAEAKK